MRTIFIAFLALAGLAGCKGQVHRTDARGGGDVHIVDNGGSAGDNVSVDVPGFAAKIALPAMDIARHVDLDGIRLAPDTKVRGIDLAAHDSSGEKRQGRVFVTFASPQPPASLLDYYRRSATDAGFEAVTATDSAMTAAKKGKQFALAVAPAGTGSTGTITISGGD